MRLIILAAKLNGDWHADRVVIMRPLINVSKWLTTFERFAYPVFTIALRSSQPQMRALAHRGSVMGHVEYKTIRMRPTQMIVKFLVIAPGGYFIVYLAGR